MAVTQKTAVNFSIDQGADFSKNFTVTTDGSTAYDISDLTLQAQMRKSYDSSSATATFTASVVTGSSGIYKLVLSNSRQIIPFKFLGIGNLINQFLEIVFSYFRFGIQMYSMFRKVEIENGVEADRIFSMLMGDDVPPRREFIENNAVYANIDA